MRILILSQYCRPEPLANAEVIGALAQGLADVGVEVHIVTPATGAEVAGVIVHRCVGVHPRDRASILDRVLEYLVFSVSGLITALRAPRPDVIVVPSPPPTLAVVGLLVARIRRTKIVYNVQDLYPEVVAAIGGGRWTGIVLAFLRRLMKVVYGRVDAVVVIDPYFAKLIRRAAPMTRVVAIRNAIDLEPFHDLADYQAIRRSWDADMDVQLVVYAGNTGRSQDLAAVVAACRALDTRLVIHGGGAAHERLRADYADEPLVSFSDFRPREDIGRVFAAGDIHVVPLRPDVAASSLPSKLLSIFAAGRPALLVAEGDSAAAQLLEEVGAGWRVEPCDPDALVCTLRSALGDRQEQLMRGKAGREWALLHAGPSRMAAEWKELLTSIC